MQFSPHGDILFIRIFFLLQLQSFYLTSSLLCCFHPQVFLYSNANGRTVHSCLLYIFSIFLPLSALPFSASSLLPFFYKDELVLIMDEKVDRSLTQLGFFSLSPFSVVDFSSLLPRLSVLPSFHSHLFFKGNLVLLMNEQCTVPFTRFYFPFLNSPLAYFSLLSSVLPFFSAVLHFSYQRVNVYY